MSSNHKGQNKPKILPKNSAHNFCPMSRGATFYPRENNFWTEGLSIPGKSPSFHSAGRQLNLSIFANRYHVTKFAGGQNWRSPRAQSPVLERNTSPYRYTRVRVYVCTRWFEQGREIRVMCTVARVEKSRKELCRIILSESESSSWACFLFFLQRPIGRMRVQETERNFAWMCV